ncbi:MAG: hypothetical protein IT269_01885 [Saprospiraceae bacterium]|nr:hypothetical protein [Saprospiraceae bacterium]
MEQTQYMVDFTLPKDLSEDFISRIPQQRSLVNKLMSDCKILNYALSLENSKLWVIFSVESEEELLELIQRLPLSRYMKVEMHALTFFNTANILQPNFSLN